MNNKMKVTGLLLGGYLLGRTKKLKLAFTVAAAASGSTLFKNRNQLQEAFKKFTDSSPELKDLQDKLSGRLAESGRGAATAVVSKGVDAVSSKLQEQTDKLNASLDSNGSQKDEAEDEQSSDEDASAENQTEDAPAEDEAEEAPAEEKPAAQEKPKAAPRKRTTTKTQSSSSTGTKAPAKRSTTGTRKQASSSASTRKSTSGTSTRKPASSSTKSQGAKK